MNVLARVLLVVFVFLLTSCTHRINHLEPEFKDTHQKDSRRVALVIPDDARKYVYVHESGGDDWNFEVGQALSTLGNEALVRRYSRVLMSNSASNISGLSGRDRIVEIEIESFEPDIGLTAFSSHDGVLNLNVKLLDANGKTKWKGKIRGSSSASSAEQVTSYIPILLIPSIGYDDSLREMLTKTVVDSLNRIISQINQS